MKHLKQTQFKILWSFLNESLSRKLSDWLVGLNWLLFCFACQPHTKTVCVAVFLYFCISVYLSLIGCFCISLLVDLNLSSSSSQKRLSSIQHKQSMFFLVRCCIGLSLVCGNTLLVLNVFASFSEHICAQTFSTKANLQLFKINYNEIFYISLAHLACIFQSSH